ncbi:MAG: class I SAM-dependent methyltransferase, partial [Planctomycetota bacterium]
MLTLPSHKAQSSSLRNACRWFDRRRLRRAARVYGPGSLPGIVWRQMRSEWRLSQLGIRFRQRQNDQACAAYGRMPWEDFCQINARQAWANWRTIPSALNGLLPRRSLNVVDLCCGTGDSTAVLAWCCSLESHILGIDVCPELIGHARQRRYYDDAGRSVPVLFRTQSVLETWCDTEGVPLEQGSIDLVNTSGAVGCHFDSDACH